MPIGNEQFCFGVFDYPVRCLLGLMHGHFEELGEFGGSVNAGICVVVPSERFL